MIKNKYASMSYAEFCSATDDNDQLILVLDEFNNGFHVWYDIPTQSYWYLEVGENDASEFFEVEPIAELAYTITDDLKIDHKEAGALMSQLFDCICCGEYVTDDGISYVWFKKVERGE